MAKYIQKLNNKLLATKRPDFVVSIYSQNSDKLHMNYRDFIKLNIREKFVSNQLISEVILSEL